MRRLSNESGSEAGFRNIGRYYLAMIPFALGIGAAVWLGVWVYGHTLYKAVAQEERAAVYVGAAAKPQGKIAIEIDNSRSCVKVSRADYNGWSLYIYSRNDCSMLIHYLSYHWQTISPNNTVLHEGDSPLCPVPTEPGDMAECQFAYWDFDSVSVDSRTDRIRVWVE